MNKLLLTGIIFLLSIPSYTQIAKIFTTAGSGSNDEPTSVLRHSSNKIITTGYYNQNITFGSTLLPFAGGEDVFITCQENAGGYTWAKRIYSPQFERSALVKEDNAGNIYVAGYFRNFAVLDNDTIFSVSNSQDIFIAKLDIIGNIIWFKAFGGSALEDIKGMAFTSNNDVWISGQFRGQTQFGAFSYQSNPFYSSGQPGFDVYITRLSSAGNVLSAFTANSPDNDRTTGLCVDDQNSIYITIQAGGILNIGNQTLDLGTSSAGALVKLSPSGAFVFGRVFNAGFVDIRGLDLRSDLIALGGDFTGDLSSTLNGLPVLTDDYPNRIFGVSLDLNGGLKSYFVESSESDLTLNAIAINNAGQIWIGGNFKCTLNSLSDDLGSGLFNNIGQNDCFIGLYTANAPNDRLYQQHFGGMSNESVQAMHSSTSFYPTIVGSFRSTLFFPFTTGCADCGNGIGQVGVSNCSDPNYSRVFTRTANGNIDIFCLTLADTTRPVLDIYFRGSGCDYSIKPPVSSPTVDTIYRCTNLTLGRFINLQSNFSGIIYNSQWFQDGSLMPFQNSPIASQTGQYVTVSTTFDGCRSFRDTLEVIFLDINSTPSLSAENTGFFNTTFSFMNCNTHLPLLLGDTLNITGQMFGANDSIVWLRATPSNPTYVVIAENTNELAVHQSGNYLYKIVTPDGCESFRCFNIFTYILVNIGGVLVPVEGGTGFGEALTFDLFFGEDNGDTIRFCQNPDFNWLNIQLGFNDTTFIPFPTFGHWDITGPFVDFPLIMPVNTPIEHSFYNHNIDFRVTESGWITVKYSMLMPPYAIDTIFQVVRQFYVERLLPPAINATITSSTAGLCPGSTADIEYTISPNIPHSVLFDNVPQDLQNLNLTFDEPVDFMLTWNYTFPETGCIVNSLAAFSLVYKTTPQSTLNPSNGRKCPEDSVLIVADPGISVAWIGSEGDTVSNEFNVQIVAPGSYYYTLIDNDTCSLISNTVEIRNITASIVDSIITSNICAGQPALILLAPDTNLNYQWLPPLFGSDTIKYIDSPGSYAVQVSLCSNTDTLRFDVEVGLYDPYLFVDGPPVFCHGDTLQFTASDTADTYLWTPGNISTQDFFVTDEGWVSVTVTDKLGCILSDSIYVVENPLPPTPDSLIAPEACPGTPITVTAQTDFPLVWHLLPDSTALATSFSYEIMPTSNQVVVSAYAINQSTGCQSSWIHQQLVLNALTQLTPIPESIIFCPGDTILIEPVPSVGITSGTWFGPNQFEQEGYGLMIPEIEAIQAGTYTFQPNPLPGFCTYDEPTLELELRQLPNPNVSYIDSLCAQETITLQTVTHPHYTYSWLGPNNTSNPEPNWIIPNASANRTGIYQLLTQVGNCVRQDSFFVFVSQLPPPIPQLAYNPSVCLGEPFYLYNADSLNTSGVNMIWLGSDQFISNSPHSAYIPNMQNSLSNTIGLQYGINQCLSEITMVNVNVNPLPVFEFEPNYEFCEGDVYQIQSPIPANAYLWGGGQTTSSIFIAESDTIILTIRDANGCRYSDTTIATAFNCLLDNTPNAFSPNGDGINDEIIFTVEGGTIYNALIFDRWGKLIKDISGTHSTWNGTTNSGNMAPHGTYFYTLRVVMLNGKEKDIQGTIAIFD